MRRIYFVKLGKQRVGQIIFFTLLLLFSPVISGSAQAGEVVPPAILASFESFSKTWMAKLEQVNQQNSRDMKPEPTSNGGLVGRYLCYGPDCLREVRGTSSKATPYVGIIRYPQKMMEKKGETIQQIKEQTGVATNETPVTEIFRYTGGRWIY